MLSDNDKALAADLRKEASLRASAGGRADVMKFIAAIKDEDLFGYISIPIEHLRKCYGYIKAKSLEIRGDAALSRAAIHLQKAAIANHSQNSK